MEKKLINNKIAVIGCGAWGLTLSTILEKNRFSVCLWAHSHEKEKLLKETRQDKNVAANVFLPRNIQITSSLKSAVENSFLIILVTASKFLRPTVKILKKLVNKKQIILSCIKGIEDKTFLTPSQIIRRELKNFPVKNLCVLSGPNLSAEIAQGKPSATVAGSSSKNTAKIVQNVLNSSSFRVYTSIDVLGLEIGGALKNIIALAAGCVDGLNLGDNAKAALITRGIVEISRLGTALGAKTNTFWGLSGIGDLICTCAGNLSRNHYVGYQIAKGRKIDEILKGMPSIAEGIKTAKAAYHLSKKIKIEIPITEQVYKVIFKNKNPQKAIMDLLQRETKAE